ncbi:MAG: extracellular solute-binding protein [Methylophilus sp.]
MFFILLSIFGVLGFYNTSLAENVQASPKTVSVLTRAGFDTKEAQALKQTVVKFNRMQHSYKVIMQHSNYRDYESLIHNAASTGSLPCLLELDGPYLSSFAWLGYLQSLDKFIPDELRHDLLPSIIAQGTYNGHIYSLGQYDSGLGLWANRRYLNSASIRIPTTDKPWSLLEFEHAMEKLSSIKGVDYPLNLAVYAKGTQEFYTYAYSPILQGFGGDLIDRSDYHSARGVLDGVQSVAAMQRFQSWFKKGWSRPVVNHNNDFEMGKTALSWTGHWKYQDYRHALGNDLILLPLPDFGHGIKTGMGSFSWGIASSCAEPEGAAKFLNYLMSAKEITRATNNNGALPARLSVLKQSPIYGKQGQLSVYAQQLTKGCGVPRPVTPGYSTISRAFSDAVNAIIAGADVQTSLSIAATEVDKDIARNQGYPQ